MKINVRWCDTRSLARVPSGAGMQTATANSTTPQPIEPATLVRIQDISDSLVGAKVRLAGRFVGLSLLSAESLMLVEAGCWPTITCPVLLFWGLGLIA